MGKKSSDNDHPVKLYYVIYQSYMVLHIKPSSGDTKSEYNRLWLSGFYYVIYQSAVSLSLITFTL
jgi:hypothetical protein